jgi:hypothetical protein
MAKGERPTHKVLVSRQSEDKSKTFYNQVGSGWAVKNNGISLQLDALPVDGRLVIFPVKEKPST